MRRVSTTTSAGRWQAASLLGRARAAQPPADSASLQQRQRQLLQLAAWGMACSALPWALVMLWRGNGLAAACYALVLLGSALLWHCAQAGLQRAALLLLSASAWLAVCGVATWVDRPTPELPRGIQTLLLPLLLLQRCLLADHEAGLRRLLIAASLACFVACSALPDLAGGPRLLSEGDRLVGLALAAAAAFGLSLAVLRLQASELRGHTRLTLELMQALRHDELELHLQPQCDAQGALVGAEALLRWQHPRLGELGGATLIELAGRHQLLLPLGDWALGRALQLAQRWQPPSPLAGLCIALNLCAEQIADEQAFEALLQRVREAGLPPGRLRLELAEALCQAEDPLLAERLQRCRELGLPTSLDDFGSGLSSLAHLSRLPFDQLKIDQRFIQDLDRDARHQHVTEAVLALGRELGMTVLAKGVESSAQLEVLLRLGCRYFQGRWFCAPLAPAAFELWALQRAAGR